MYKPHSLRGPLAALLVVMFAATVARAQDYYVVPKNGKPVKVYALSATADGRIVVEREKNVKTELRSGDYDYLVTPEPPAYSAAQKAAAAGSWDKVVEFVNRGFDEVKLLGWGGAMSLLRGRAYFEKGDYDSAFKSLNDGRRYASPPTIREQLMLMLARTLIAQDRVNEADELLSGMASEDSDVAPRIYLMRGMLQERKQKKDDAVLEYLKVVLLFPEAGAPRKEALEHVIALLKEQKDIRWREFDRTLQEEYGG